MSTLVGGVLLLHAAYSSYEHHQLVSAAVPRDIVLELLVGLILINFGAIKANTPRLAVSSHERVSPLKKYLSPIDTSQAMVALKKLGFSEHEQLETRVDFMDVRQKRAEYLRAKAE